MSIEQDIIAVIEEQSPIPRIEIVGALAKSHNQVDVMNALNVLVVQKKLERINGGDYQLKQSHDWENTELPITNRIVLYMKAHGDSSLQVLQRMIGYEKKIKPVIQDMVLAQDVHWTKHGETVRLGPSPNASKSTKAPAMVAHNQEREVAKRFRKKIPDNFIPAVKKALRNATGGLSSVNLFSASGLSDEMSQGDFLEAINQLKEDGIFTQNPNMNFNWVFKGEPDTNKNNPEKEGLTKSARTILDAAKKLKHSPFTTDDLIKLKKKTGLGESSVRNALTELVRAGDLFRIKLGTYTLPTTHLKRSANSAATTTKEAQPDQEEPVEETHMSEDNVVDLPATEEETEEAEVETQYLMNTEEIYIEIRGNCGPASVAIQAVLHGLTDYKNQPSPDVIKEGVLSGLSLADS